MLIKFKDAGKWADSPADPVFDVEAGQIIDVSEALGKVVIDAGKGMHVTQVRDIDPKTPPPVVDKVRADKGQGFKKKRKAKKR